MPGTETAGRQTRMTTVAPGLSELLPTPEPGIARGDFEADDGLQAVEPVRALLGRGRAGHPDATAARLTRGAG